MDAEAPRSDSLLGRMNRNPSHTGGLSVGPPGLEPGTSSLSGMRSNRAELWALDDGGHQARELYPLRWARRSGLKFTIRALRSLVSGPASVDDGPLAGMMEHRRHLRWGVRCTPGQPGHRRGNPTAGSGGVHSLAGEYQSRRQSICQGGTGVSSGFGILQPGERDDNRYH